MKPAVQTKPTQEIPLLDAVEKESLSFVVSNRGPLEGELESIAYLAFWYGQKLDALPEGGSITVDVLPGHRENYPRQLSDVNRVHFTKQDDALWSSVE